MNAVQIARPALSTRSGRDVLLERVHVQGSVRSTLARIRMTQVYRNLEATNIEAVYTFPLPPSATLLDVVVELNGKKYRGTVLEKAKAEERYEDAVAEGNTALMVERPEPGLYTMNLGNLLAGESASIEIEYAMLLDWRNGRMRLSLPMTVAPRYDEEHSALAPQQKPPVDALLERPFSLSLRLSSDLAKLAVQSPTHRVSFRNDNGETIVSLSQESAWMDRDFVLAIDSTEAPAPALHVARDGESNVTYASFQLPPAAQDSAPRNVKIVLDCSVSMAGDSIWHARAGVLKLLDQLRPQDRFGLVAFGSAPEMFATKLIECTEMNLEAAKAWVRDCKADMGGTEMEKALQAAFGMNSAEKGSRCDLFLLTDGEIGRTAEVIATARKSGHRVFVAAVGTSPAVSFLQQLANDTGGAFEQVTPNEDMADAIAQLFTRLTQQRIRNLAITGDAPFTWTVGADAKGHYTGDTIHFFGESKAASNGVSVEWEFEDGEVQRVDLAGGVALENEDAAALPRIAAAARIRALSVGTSSHALVSTLAARYQLVTAVTNYLLVIDRGEARAVDMPEIRQVAHMLAAGYGGSGTVGIVNSRTDFDALHCLMSVGESHSYAPEAVGHIRSFKAYDATPDPHASIAKFLSRANRQHASLLVAAPLVDTLSGLERLALPDEILDELRALIAGGASEESVVIAFWAALLMHRRDLEIKRGLQRSVRRSKGSAGADPMLVARIGLALQHYLPLAADSQ